MKEECLSRLILFGESSLRRALQQYIVHYHEERNYQGKDNRILSPSRPEATGNMGAVRCRERLGGPAEVLREGRSIKVDGTAALNQNI
jgi:putative transposase